jgi:mannose-6-phosphate isomerase-like protein (cupin superfamily)
MAYRHDADGPLTTISHDRPGWIVVRMEYDLPGCRTKLHVHRFDHWMVCEVGAALVEIDGKMDVVKSGDRYLVEKGKAHGVMPIMTGTVLRCEHEIRAENGEHDRDAFSPDGVPVEWVQRLTERWGPAHVAR